MIRGPVRHADGPFSFVLPCERGSRGSIWGQDCDTIPREKSLKEHSFAAAYLAQGTEKRRSPGDPEPRRRGYFFASATDLDLWQRGTAYRPRGAGLALLYAEPNCQRSGRSGRRHEGVPGAHSDRRGTRSAGRDCLLGRKEQIRRRGEEIRRRCQALSQNPAGTTGALL